MEPRFKDCDRNTFFLMPPSVDDWVPENHLSRFVVDIVARLDLSPIKNAYAGRGSDAYPPNIMVALLFYGYATGVFSSRKIEGATYDSVAFRYIAANTHPDHDTIASFRKRFLKELKALFVQILMIAHEMGVMKLGSVSLDGTKIKANASKHHALSWDYARKLEKQLKGEIKDLLRKAQKADKEKETGKKPGGPRPKPPEPGPKSKDQANLTDSESRIMPSSKGGFEQAYNGQAAVDIDSMLIVENHITQQSNDKLELAPAVENLSRLPEALGTLDTLLADTGYFSSDNVEKCESNHIVPYIAVERQQHNAPPEDRFTEPAPLTAPADPVTEMKHRLKTIAGKAVYAKRKSTVEPVFGIIKAAMGFRQFLLRGLDLVSGEWDLVCIAYNIKRLHVLSPS